MLQISEQILKMQDSFIVEPTPADFWDLWWNIYDFEALQANY